MVSFICDACGNTVKKNQVEKHYQTVCRNCSVLSCIDCGVDFPGDAYITHTSCISEAEKYQGHLYQPKDKENKGDAKQKQWIKQVQGATGNVNDPKLKALLEKLSDYSNIPRKKKKFENFCKNSVKVYDSKTLDALWDIFSQTSDKQQASNGSCNTNGKMGKPEDKDDRKNENMKRKIDDSDDESSKKKTKKTKDSSNDCENNETEGIKKDTKQSEKGKFHWHKAIKIALKEADENELSIKKLRKKVIAAYEEHGFDHRASTIEESKNLFERKLNTYPKVKILKEKTVKLCKT